MTPAVPRAPLSGSLVVFVLVLLLAVLDVVARFEPNTWINRDGRFYTNVNATLVESASLDQDEFCASWYDGRQGWNHNLDASWSNVALGRDDRRLPKHPVLLPLLSTPLYWAFGVFGSLVFNVLAFALAGLLAYSLARRFAAPTAAALAACAFLLATGIREYAYDYHVDVLLLALFLGGVVALGRGRGVLGGVLLAACVTLKPTVLLFVPTLALLVEARPTSSEKKGSAWRTLGGALVGGGIVLALFALANTWYFGRPWWAGYNRVLVVVAGRAQIADVSNTFDVPFEAGLEQLWSGPYGIRDRLTLALYGLPALALLWRRPRFVVATLVALVASVVLFARYRWYADRFLWPAFALVVPALAMLFDRAPRLLRTLGRLRPTPALGVGLACALCVTATLPGGPEIDRRVPDDAWSRGALALAEGELTLERGGAHAIEREGVFVPRQSPIATVVAAPFARFGREGLVILHVLLVLLLGAAITRFAATGGGWLQGAIPALALVLGPSIDGVGGMAVRLAGGGVELFAATLGFGALAIARRRPIAAGALAASACLVGSAPWPFPLALLVLAGDRRDLSRMVAGLTLGAVIAVVANLSVVGAPHVWELGPVVRDPSPAMLASLVLAPLGLLFARGRLAVVVGVLLLGLLWPGARLDVVVTATLALPLAALVPTIARALGRIAWWSPRRRRWAVVALALALFAAGAIPRVVEAHEPLRFATYRGFRTAKVRLGRTPCDFLNWQHMTWECATRDQGVVGMVGLPVTLPVLVAGRERELLRIPNQGSSNRTVTWEAVPATERLVLRWAVPDETTAGGTLIVRIDDEERARIELPSRPDGRVHVERIDSAVTRGRVVEVVLELEGRGAAVAVDGGFE